MIFYQSPLPLKLRTFENQLQIFMFFQKKTPSECPNNNANQKLHFNQKWLNIKAKKQNDQKI